ncbi:phosphohydrolase [Epibacterium sp. MM17-32]|uniref:phosphohydrolase n=1 Tax=Epibacterium sp. MM17-32 TaxID=2917734 RepID=UPI001EF4E49C|nr:phosphohydrolase [Epibacterium sp. MM17-32]MCG7629046.1 phosphohydrolase [Epibacterium sp. MM17-32]
MCPSLQQTETLVREKFAGQTDRRGDPLFNHITRVVGYLEGEDEHTLHAAWLHDIVEDTDVTVPDLIEMGYSEEVVDAVTLLTHNKKAEPYADYIDRICQSGNLRAIKVKLADQQDNLDPRRWLGLNRFVQNALRKRYAGVKDKLMEAAINATV